MMEERSSYGSGEHERLRVAALKAIQEGRPGEAEKLLDTALELAGRSGDPELEDRAYCNRAALLIQQGDLDGPLPHLRRILMANRSLQASFLAAFNISRIYSRRGESKKGLFYAQVARDRAAVLQDDEWLGGAFNQIGNFQAAESRFSEAATTYRRVLTYISQGASEYRFSASLNLGYCELMEGRLERGLRLVYRSLRAARRERWRRLEMIASLDLCYGLLERKRLRLAWRHGSRGLAIAEEIGEPDHVKNALFLMGEVAVIAGDVERGYAYFHDLQERFYPDQPYIPELLVSVDVRGMINLRA